MFVRKKRNSSGKICVQVIDKSKGKYKVLHTIGSSHNSDVIRDYELEAKSWIKRYSGSIEIDFTDELNQANQFLEGIQSLQLAGLDLLIGKLFDEIGFNKIRGDIFRYLVMYRLAYPKSKLKTTQYLYRYHQIEWDEDRLYRYMDKLYNTQKEMIQQISYEHTLKILGGCINIVFYDVTTLYFEIDKEDDLRKTGFSKEGKHQNPQVVLGLLVSTNGYPLAYDIFEGNKFEGHTMLPVIESFKQRYELDQLIIVADSGLLSNTNIEELLQKGYQFILGARIKSETHQVKEKILKLELENGDSALIEKGDLNLIITYSDTRAKKDLLNREKGLKRLEKQLQGGRLTKANINKRGYNKYLKLEGELKVIIDREKFKEDARWDGLKGYITNSKLPKEQIIENYLQLWQIEKAFRVAKTDIKIRPVFHRLPSRIEAHICIAFTAYKIYKELERQLYHKNAQLSPETAIEIAKSIFEIKLQTPQTKTTMKKLLLLNQEQKYLADLFGF